MRWVVTVATALCLLAACGERPRDATANKWGAAHFVRGLAGTALSSPVRRDPHDPRLGLSPYIVTVAQGISAPTMLIPRSDAGLAPASFDAPDPVATSRGPPRG